MDAGGVAAISSSAVAIVAIIANEVRHRRSLQHARELADLESVRGVMDDAAAALHDATYAIDGVRAGVLQHGLGLFEDEGREKPFRAVRRAGERLDQLLERLKIRLGREHEAVKAFETADAAALEIFRSAELIKLEDRPTPGDDTAAHHVADFLAEQRKRIDAEREEFGVSRDEFIDAAQRAAGADLPD
jgi:aspartate aminotransferase-like enzyme